MSLKGDKYETREEIEFRILNTVVLYDNKPVYITKIGYPEDEEEVLKKEIARVFFVELPYGGEIGRGAKAGKEVRKYLSSKNFDLTPFKMGYCNHKGEATFISRRPIRQNRQGFCQGNANFTDARGRQSETFGWGKAIASSGFVDMINGKYPSFAELGDFLGDGEHSSVALSRNFACVIDNDLEALLLMHKGTKCGLALKGDKALRVSPKYHFLKNEIEECRIPLA